MHERRRSGALRQAAPCHHFVTVLVPPGRYCSEGSHHMALAAALVTEEHSALSVLTDADETIMRVPEAPPRLINPELSWLQFNLRVLAEALDERTPLLERVRFLSIFYSNLDEFFMIRVSGLRTQMTGAAAERSADGLTPGEQLGAIRSDL